MQNKALHSDVPPPVRLLKKLTDTPGTKDMKSIITPLILLTSITVISIADTNLSGIPSNDPKELADRVIDNLLSRETMYYGNKGLHYAETCAAVGALRFAQKQNDTERLERIIARYEKLLEPGTDLVSRLPHVDQFVTGALPLQIYMINGDKRHLELGLSFADQQWENPTKDGLTSQTRWWIDDMYMVGMLQIQAYRATKEMKYADRAALQLAAYLKKLQTDNGLFYHGPKFHYHWGRGNGWVAVSLAEVLSELPADHKLQPEIMKAYRKMMASLLAYQSDNGMWRQLIDYEYSWAESSCTAMFAFAMSVGLNRGWLDATDYEPAVKKAVKALCAHVDRKGQLREICRGTNQQDDIEFYLNRPRTLGDFHGQAPFLWLVAEHALMESK
jgi:unsaturated rhamnogalacturonyl hydrolase